MNRKIGIGCAVLAAFIYGFTPVLAKITYLDGSNTITLTFFRSLFSFPVLFLLLKHKGVSLKVSKKEFGILGILGFLGAFATGLMLYGAYNYISVGLTSCIHFIYPVLVALVCMVVFKDRLSRAKLLALALAVFGLILFLEDDVSFQAVGVSLAFGSGVAYALYLIVMDKTGIKKLDPFLISFYCCGVASVFLFVFGTASKQLVYDITPRGWVFTFIVAMLVSVVANTLTPMAVKRVGPTVTAILGMFEPIVSVATGFLFLGEPCTLQVALGCCLVIAAVVVLTLEKDSEKSTEKSPS